MTTSCCFNVGLARNRLVKTFTARTAATNGTTHAGQRRAKRAASAGVEGESSSAVCVRVGALPELAVMRGSKYPWPRVTRPASTCDPPWSGLQFLHERACAHARFRRAPPPLSAKDLVGLLVLILRPRAGRLLPPCRVSLRVLTPAGNLRSRSFSSNATLSASKPEIIAVNCRSRRISPSELPA